VISITVAGAAPALDESAPTSRNLTPGEACLQRGGVVKAARAARRRGMIGDLWD